MNNQDVKRLMKYVFYNIGDGCPSCVGESVYRFYCEFCVDIDVTLDDLYDMVNESRELLNDDKSHYVTVDSGGVFIANELSDLKQKMIDK